MTLRRSSIAALLLLPLSAAHARTLTLFLGDTNTTHNGAGSADDVYVDPAWVGALVAANVPGAYSDFDVSRVDHNVPFTFLFPLQPSERVVAATLSLSLRSTYTEVSTDAVLLESPRFADAYDYADMGWLPLPGTGTSTRALNLATALGRNSLPLLQDGQLNVLIRDDSFVNHATLSLRITSLPGDANANDVIDPDDYALLDRGHATQPPTPLWSQGDFNADGTVDHQDYLLIDAAHHDQADGFAPGLLARRESQFGTAYVQSLLTSIPEPSSLACLFATLPVIRRRR